MLSAAELLSIQGEFSAVFLRSTATVYVVEPGSGRFSMVAKTGLACWLTTMAVDTTQSVESRDELAARRLFYYDPAYTLPEVCAVECVDPSKNGTVQRFNPVTGTQEAQAGPDGTV